MKSIRSILDSLVIIGVLTGSLNLVHASTNTLWLSLSGVSNGWLTLTLNGTQPGSNYTLLSQATLTASNWSAAGLVTGAQNQSWTAVQVPGTETSWYVRAQYYPGGTNSGGGGGGTNGGTAGYGTNLWLSSGGVSKGVASLTVANSEQDILYEIQGKTNLLQPDWVSYGFVYGSELTNWTPASLPVNQQGNLFLRIRSWADSTGTGIPDWWWLQYFGQITNVDSSASAMGDGYSNLQKFQMGLNPTNYYNLNALSNFFGYVVGSNAFIMWSPATGLVLNYAIQRGILNTNTGNYVYTQFLVSSNATWFEDVGAITNGNAQNNIYNLEAVYPGGSLSGTNTWQVYWYANWGSYGPPYGPPTPGNVYAYVDSTGTNVQVSWTSAGGMATNYLVERGTNTGSYSYVYSPIAQVGTNVTSYKDVGALTNANNWVEAYAVAAVYPGGGLSYAVPSYSGDSFSPISLGSNNGPAAPANFFGYVDWVYYPWEAGTNLFLIWSPSPSAVAYIIYAGNWDNSIGCARYQPIGRVSGTSFELAGGTDGNGNYLYHLFAVVAVYSDGSMSQNASWSPYDGVPAPGALNAYVDSTGTNVEVLWSPVPGATGYSVQRSDYGNEYYEIAETDAGTTSYLDVDEVDNANLYGHGIDAVSYQVVAFLPNGGYSAGATAGVSNTPPAPTGLTATVDSTGTNVLLAWSPAVGSVTGYTILRGTYNPSTGNYSYSQIGTTGAGTTSFEDVGAFSGGNDNNNIYEVEADYAGGSLSQPISSSLYQPSTPPTYNINVTAQMVRNQTGHWQLMFSSIPSTVQTIAFYWYFWDYFYDFGASPDTIDFDSNGQPLTTENDIPVSSITNGIYVLPDFLMTNWFPNNELGKVAMIQPIGTNNQYGRLSQAGFQPYDSPTFVDGQQHLKQNLLYQLRSATVSQPNAPLSENGVWWDPWFQSESIPVDTNYVESSIFHWSLMFKGYNAYDVEYLKMDDVWPITVNYELHGGLYDPNFNGSSFNWQPNVGADFPTDLEFQGTLATIPAPAVLGVGDPYWVSQGLGNLADVAAYTNSGNLYLQSSYHNLYGLSFAAALVDTPGGWHINMLGQWENGSLTTLSPGGSVSEANVSTFYSQTADPSLSLVNYYFAPVNTPGTALPNENAQIQPYPLPALTGFASTNQTGMMITSVGTPAVIGGWAKFALQNSSKFAYLGQYYITNAFMFDANGNLTTNTTGIVSPYGNFFPTQPGMVAMVTMPDIDTGAQGTGVVRVVSLNVDAVRSGTMDFTYNGPDFVSSSKPFRFWINDNQDDGDYGGNGIPGQGTRADGVLKTLIPNSNLVLGTEIGWQIHGRRDLVDFFPVYLNIGSLFQNCALSAGISATDTNYQFILSQADGALRFTYTDLTPTNYMNFLRDTIESSNLADAPLITISNGGVALSPSFIAGIATNNQGIILVEAWEITTQPLVLTIYHGSNQIAQTSLYLSINGVEQMFRHKNLMLDPNATAPGDRLTDASVPNEPDTTDVNFIFLHGYNVNTNQARGWDADIYKRLYWSGSHAKFYGVTWEAADSQVANAVTINLQTNIVHAFATAPLLNTFLNGLTGTNVVAAHSLGNMLMLSTLNDYSNQNVSTYFMIDAAVAIEAIDINAPQNPDMYPSIWTNYQSRLWSSQWHNLFPANDGRGTLTWSGRLSNLQNASVYNFYSSGEEVLRDYPADPPGYLLTIAWGQFVSLMEGTTGEYTWAWQEKCKGLMSGNGILSSDHGGWKFNDGSYGTNNSIFNSSSFTHMSPAAAALLPNAEIQTNAFFDVTDFIGQIPFDWTQDLALYGTAGSSYAQANQNRLLSDTIPCLTLPVGANPVPDFDSSGRNFDMQTLYENGWPLGRNPPKYPVGTTAFGEWHHSDVRAVAYTFTYPLFNQIATLGNLK